MFLYRLNYSNGHSVLVNVLCCGDAIVIACAENQRTGLSVNAIPYDGKAGAYVTAEKFKLGNPPRLVTVEFYDLP